MSKKTADLYDQLGDQLQVVEPIFRHFGGKTAFCGRISTVKVHEDNKLVRAELENDGAGRVLVVDGGGSLRSALVGGNIAKLAADNRWAGVLVYGCIRDSLEVAETPVGMMALATCPVKPKKNGFGEVGITLRFGGAVFTPGAHLYADEDGIVISGREISGA